MSNEPIEVYVHHRSAHTVESLESQPRVVQQSVIANGVRYLRANLTCGECSIPWGFRASDCPRGFVFPTSKHMINEIQKMLDGQPACMAFKVKP